MELLIVFAVYLAIGIVTCGFIIGTSPSMDCDGAIWLSVIWPVFWLLMLGVEIGQAMYGGDTVDYGDTKKNPKKPGT